MTDSNSDFNAKIIDSFRANHGVVGGPWEGKRLVVLHHVGRRSGREYVTPLVSATDGDAYLICGSMGGAPNDPQWVKNLEGGPGETTIEVGDDLVRVKPTVVRPEAADWERLYGTWAAYWPDSTEYEKNTTRKFPVVRLEPIA
jgi:deazaflavin-dependent oxidoreductase (nitroreductase family)